MSLPSSPQPDAGSPPYRRLKLVMSTSEHPQKTLGSADAKDALIKTESSRSSTPTRPSYSPVTPTLSHSSATGPDAEVPEWIDEPASTLR